MNNLITKETTEEEHKKVYESYPETFKGGLEANPFYMSRVAPIYYEIPDGCRVLDIGCNNGEFMNLLKTKKKCKVWGVDLSSVALEEARTRGLNVEQASAEKLPFKDRSFDVVVLMEVIAHVLNPDKALQEARRVLRKGGFLLGSTPHKNLEDYMWEDKRLHRRYYTQWELLADLRESFSKNYLKTLKGGQFSLGLSESFIAKEDAEILFKSGGDDTLDWEEALKDKSILRAWFGPTQGPGDVYYRMRGFIDKMRSDKVEIGYEPYSVDGDDEPGAWQQKVRQSKDFPGRPVSTISLHHLEQCLKAADLSIWQITPYKDVLAVLRCAKDILKKPMITELDDWLFDLPSYNIASNPYSPNSECEWVAYEQMKHSDAFIVSTEFIKKMCNEMFPHIPAYIVRNAIDFNVWDKLDPVPLPRLGKEDGKIRIGYTGCANHDEDIKIVKEPLLALLEEYPNLEFIYPSHGLDSWREITHPRVLKWNTWVNIEKYPHHIAGWKMDIGIAPLRDNTFNRAKSNLRWLEYSALKVPTIASPVEPFKRLTEGKTGFLADSKKDWYEKLKMLIENKDLRLTVGEKAYQEVKKNFNMDKVAREYISVLKEIKRVT